MLVTCVRVNLRFFIINKNSRHSKYTGSLRKGLTFAHRLLNRVWTTLSLREIIGATVWCALNSCMVMGEELVPMYTLVHSGTWDLLCRAFLPRTHKGNQKRPFSKRPLQRRCQSGDDAWPFHGDFFWFPVYALGRNNREEPYFLDGQANTLEYIYILTQSRDYSTHLIDYCQWRRLWLPKS